MAYLNQSVINLPNAISVSRIFMIPLAWYAALAGARWMLVVIISLCLVTDFLDGFFARLLNQETSFGARLDSTADNILLVSAVPMAWMIDPSIFAQHAWATTAFLTLLLAVFAVMFIRHRRMVAIHTLASKFGAVFMWLFLIHGWAFGYNEVLAVIFFVSSYYYLCEDLILLTTRARVDEDERGFLFRRRAPTLKS